MDSTMKAIPVPTVRRLPLYLAYLKELGSEQEYVSGTWIAERFGLLPIQVRKDLAITGVVGRPRLGYPVAELIEAIESMLGWKNAEDAFLVGAGHLGRAILGYREFRNKGLRIVAAFDNNPEKIGSTVSETIIFPMDKLSNLIRRMHVNIGILTVSPESAQMVADEIVAAGIRAIWNFAPVALRVPDNVIVENVRLVSSLSVLTSKLRMQLHPPLEGTRVAFDETDETTDTEETENEE